MSDDVEVRCPVGPQRLFVKLKLGEEFGGVVAETNLFEFTCSDCSRRATRADGGHQKIRVYHRYNFIGELIQTEAVVESWICGTAFASEMPWSKGS